MEGQSKSAVALPSSEIPIPPPELRKGNRAQKTEAEYKENAVGLVTAIDTLATMAKIMKEIGGEAQWAKIKLQEQFADSYLKGKNVMDYGCGPGRMLIGMKLAGIEYGQYVGVDVEEASIKWLNEFLPEAKHKYVWIDIANERYNPNGKQYDPEHPVQQLESIGATMDVIHLRSVFSHMRATDIFNHLQGLKSNLREDGLLIVSLFVRNDAPEEVENPNDEGDTPLHAVQINKADFEAAVTNAGYRALLETTAMGQQTYVLTPGVMQHPLIDH